MPFGEALCAYHDVRTKVGSSGEDRSNTNHRDGSDQQSGSLCHSFSPSSTSATLRLRQRVDIEQRRRGIPAARAVRDDGDVLLAVLPLIRNRNGETTRIEGGLPSNFSSL